MSNYKFSKRSLSALESVHPDLQRVMHKALQYTDVDFGVTEGLRSFARQQELVAKGASQTMDSIHLQGRAVDVAAYIGGKLSWDLKHYPLIADAVRKAAIEEGVAIRWGGAWTVGDVRGWSGDMQSAMDDYVSKRRAAGRKPFIDAVHFEMV